ncbi:MAG TPA: GAF domain-containing SpoIIE family protein phosphatase [Candidatus Eisenbacteria bacterium]|jgi:GAF domain-containing protein
MSPEGGGGTRVDGIAAEGTPVPGTPGIPDTLERLEEVRAKILPAASVESVAPALLAVMADFARASRASLMMTDPASGRLRIVAAVGLPAHVVGQVLQPARRRISDWVFREKRSLVLNGEVHDERFESSAAGEAIESALSVPLVCAAAPIGVVNLARGAPGALFGADEIAAVERLTRPVAETLERLQELLLAEHGRSALFAAVGSSRTEPLRIEVLPARNYQMAVARAVSPSVSGDFLERVHHAEGAQSLLAADVAAEGPLAVGDAGLVRGLFVALSESVRLPARVAASVGRAIHGRLGPGRPVAAWLAHLSSNGGLASCAAGYPGPLWIPVEGGSPRPLDTGGPALGVAAETSYEQETIRMLPGDLVIAASDAVLGASDAAGESFGLDRLSELAADHRRQPPEQLADTLCRAALSHASGRWPADDFMVFVLRFAREP